MPLIGYLLGTNFASYIEQFDHWIAFVLLGACGILEYTTLLTNVPILAYGLPAVFSLYFDLFSGFVQALVFTLLTMVYIAGVCPPPENKTEK